MHLQYHKLETEKDLNLLAYRPLLVVIAASFGFLWSLLAVHMIQLHFILTKLSHDWLFEQSAAHERGGQFW